MKIVKISLLILGILLGVSGCNLINQFGLLPFSHGKEGYEKLDYYKDGVFISAKEMRIIPENLDGDISWTNFLKKSKNAPKTALPKVELNKNSFASIPENFALYWLGHSSAIVELDGKRLIIDPVLENAAFLPGIARRFDSSPLKREEIPEVDIVLITHDHYDHLEADTMKYLSKREGIKFIVPLGVGKRLKRWGISENSIYELGWEESVEFESIKIIALEGIHYSGRIMIDKNRTLWASYAIKSKDKNIFWSGDTAYGEHFKKIGEKHGPFDLAGLEIDGWNDAWVNIHLTPEEAVKVAKELRAEIVLPLHWGTFDLAFQPWKKSINLFKEEADKNGVSILTPIQGEKVIPGISETKDWWNR